jgi:hypothetical protein
LVKPETVIGEDAPVPVKPPGLEVTVYPVIVAGYPAFAGAVKVTDAEAKPPVAVPIVGALGTVGQAPAGPIACNCCLDVQRPEKLGIAYLHPRCCGFIPTIVFAVCRV